MDDYAFLPIKNPRLIKYYTDQKNVFWTPADIDMSGDREDWNKLDDNTKHFIKFILCFFAQADGIVIENLMGRFQEETSKWKEAKAFYAMQNAMETIHNETYSLLIEAFITDNDEKNKAFNAISNYKSIKKIADWIIAWMNSDTPLTERVIAFCCVEGVLFSGAFAAIYWVKRLNILKGLCKSNEYIQRDECIHKDFGCELYHFLQTQGFDKVTDKRVREIIESCMVVVEEFINDALKVDLIGMNSSELLDYVKCTADNLSEQLGYKKVFEVENPYDWMATIGMTNKTNFFEDRVTEYSQNDSKFSFEEKEDF